MMNDSKLITSMRSVFDKVLVQLNNSEAEIGRYKAHSE